MCLPSECPVVIMPPYGQFVGVTLLTLTVLCGSANSHTMEDSRRLLANIRANYTRELRPLYNQSSTQEVMIGFDILSIMDLDEVQERITVTAVLFQMWEDEYFTWDPQEYGGLEYIVTGTTRVWVPHILLTNGAKQMYKLTEDWHLLHIEHDGVVIYGPGDIFSATCSIDVTYYPFDVQTCSFMFIPMGYPTEQLKLWPYHNKIYFDFFSDNGAWTVKDSFVVKAFEDGEGVRFGIILERKPLFVLVNVLLPLTFMSVLNTLVFLLPSESGERMSFCITVLLAIAVFLTLVGDILPKTSSPMSLYSYYLLSVLVISLCITLCTIFSLHLYHREESEPIGYCWRRFVACLKCQRKRKHGTTPARTKRCIPATSTVDDISTAITLSFHDGISGHTNTRIENNTHCFLKPLNCRRYVKASEAVEQKTHDTQATPMCRSYINSLEQKSSFTDTDEVIRKDLVNGSGGELRWKDISVVVDKVAFIFFISLIVLDNLLFLFAISRGRHVDA